MVEPTNFCSNIETKGDNYFMQDKIENDSQKMAIIEFNHFRDLLRKNNVEIEVFKQKHLNSPDSIFPNNWFSTHKNEFFPDGLLIIYPVKALNRRMEKNQEIIEMLKKNYKVFIDLSYLENENEFLESTGSLIFDHSNRKIYCCYSDRSTAKAVNILMETLNIYSKMPFELISFNGFDKNNKRIYHTNCIMAILQNHTIICLSSIKDENERKRVKSSIEENRKIIDISFKQLDNFCGNVINLRNSDEVNLLIMSNTAKKCFSKTQKKILSKSYKILSTNVSIIEKVGGGSARCMIAEIF